MKNIAIIGAKGSMGRRYTAICRFLGLNASLYDKEDWGMASGQVGLEGIIIASPTEEHFKNLKEFKRLKLPILCEKAISKNKFELEEVLSWDMNIRMVNQYSHLMSYNPEKEGVSYYNYYNTGRDGLEWDCINIIGLSHKKPHLDNSSPVWQCKINGSQLNIKEMDQAYIDMIGFWAADPKENKDYIFKAHQKIMDGFYVKSCYRDTGETEEYEAPSESTESNKRQVSSRLGNTRSAAVSSVPKRGETRA